jgi:hypothetical protein
MTNGDPQPSSADLLREQRLQRNLKIVVGGLGALILIGLGAVIVRMAGFASAPARPGDVRTVLAAQGGTLALEIPKGARIVSVSLSGNRLAVQHEGPDGTGIAILDLDTGRRVLDVKAIEAVPRN